LAAAAPAAHAGAQGAERELAVHRREQAALAAELCELRLHDVELFRSGTRSDWVKGSSETVEYDQSIDRGVGVGRELSFERRRSVGFHDGGVEVHVARVA